jgi:hypothetical protein
MGRIARRVSDKRLLRLIRSWLKAGVLENGLVGPTDEGTPQGSTLSPLLSNLVLDQLDRELERRGPPFVRCADDCNIYVRSRRAGQRLMGGPEGEPGEKCCGTIVGAEVPRVQLYEREAAEAPNRAQSYIPVPSPNPDPYSSNSWNQHREHGSQVGPLPSGMARLIRLLPNPDRAGPFQ